jgi:hypothetical protein
MKVRRVKGRKFEGDLITEVTTKDYEWITIPRLLLIVNSIALNEQKRAEAKGWKQQKQDLWFNRMCERVLEDGFMGIDLLDDKNLYLLEEYEKRFKLSTLKQTKIEEFENGSS